MYAGFIAEFDDRTIKEPQEDIADLLIRLDSYHRLYAALEKLSEIQRRRLEMRYFDGLTYRMIAEIENVSHNAIKKSVAQAIGIISKYLSN